MISKNKKQKIVGQLLVAATVAPLLSTGRAFASDSDGSSGGGVSTAVLPSNWGIEDILRAILITVTTGVGIAATLSIVFAGVIYATAFSDSGKVAKAKTMITNTVVGLIAYAFMWSFLEWVIPGGLF